MSQRGLKTAIAVALPILWPIVLGAQVSSAGTGAMIKPPPVSGQSYRMEVGMEEKENFISGSILAGGGYVNNLYPGANLGELSEKIMSVQPTLSFDTSSARLHTTAAYSPNFIFYFPTSSLNEADQNGSFNIGYRFNPRLTLDLSERFLKSSTGFAQIGNGGVPGSASGTAPLIPVPFGKRFSNFASGALSYQFSPHGMLGGSANTSFVTFPKTTQTDGLFNSDSRGAGGFYSHRLSASQYLGATYQYQQTLSYPEEGQYDVQTHTINGFYTIYLSETFSLSVAGGPQRFTETYLTTPTTGGWSPSVSGSLGWQNQHTSFAANVSRNVSGGGGLIGAFVTKSAVASGRWQISRLWDSGMNIAYVVNKNVNNENVIPLVVSPGGHSLTASVSVGRSLSRNVRLLATYDHILAKYQSVPSLDASPNSDRVLVSVSWIFRRPVGR